MSYLNNDGSGLVGGKLPSGTGQALRLDSSGNLLMSNGVTGQQTSASSTSVVIASDQNVPVKGAALEIIGNGTGVVNAVNTDLIPATDVSAFRWLSLQISGTFSLTLSFQGSNDNVNFVPVKFILTSSYTDNNAATSTSTTNQIWSGPILFRYLRVRATSFTSNTSLAGVLELYALAPYLPLTNPTTFLAPQSSGGTSNYHLVSAASNNASTIKASPGQIYGYEIYNSNAAVRYVKIYNKASGPNPASDTPLRTIAVPAGSRISYHNTVGIQCTSGIALATVTGMADNDNTSVGAGDLVVEVDYK